MKNLRVPSAAWMLLAGCLLPHAWAAPAPRVTLPPITVRALPGTDAAVFQDLAHVLPAKGTGPATLQLDLAHKRILNATGQVVAWKEATRPLYLQATLDKWRYVQALGTLSKAHPQDIHLSVSDQTGNAVPRVLGGQTVNFVVPDMPPQRQLAVFDMSPIGTLHAVYFRESSDKPAPFDTVIIPAEAKPPYGADHVVAVSAQDPEGMHQFITWLAETTEAQGLIDTQGEILQQMAHLRDVRIGILYTYTCATAADCGP